MEKSLNLSCNWSKTSFCENRGRQVTSGARGRVQLLPPHKYCSVLRQRDFQNHRLNPALLGTVCHLFRGVLVIQHLQNTIISFRYGVLSANEIINAVDLSNQNSKWFEKQRSRAE